MTVVRKRVVSANMGRDEGRGSTAVVKMKNQRRSVQVVLGEGGGAALREGTRGERKVTLLTHL